MKIIILHSDIAHNADLDEQETLFQVQAIKQELEKDSHQVSCLAFTLNFTEIKNKLLQQAPDIVFNLVESIETKANHVFLAALLLQELNLPYTGANSHNLFITTNKLLTKYYLMKAELPTPEWIFHTSAEINKPYIVKSVCEHGSVGIEQDSVVKNHDELQFILNDRKERFGGDWFAEEYIEGREINVAFISEAQNVQIFPIAEMLFSANKNEYAIVDYTAKWRTESDRYHAIERSFTINDANLVQRIHKIVHQAVSVFNLAGYFRMDLRIDNNSNIFILEINANPSLAPDAGFAAQANEFGVSYNALITSLISNTGIVGSDNILQECRKSGTHPGYS